MLTGTPTTVALRFSGPEAARVWSAIKDENCFEDDGDGVCLEERVFGRILSGLQTSISSHLSTKYPIGPDEWGPNVDLYVQKVGKHRLWLKNLHFLFLFMVRAVAKAAPLLREQSYYTGNPADDQLTKALVAQLTRVEVPNVLRGFDESKMFKVRRLRCGACSELAGFLTPKLAGRCLPRSSFPLAPQRCMA